jgi:hypothetical protein
MRANHLNLAGILLFFEPGSENIATRHHYLAEQQKFLARQNGAL